MKDWSNIKIHIIGGTGQMGNWLRNFLERKEISVTVSGKHSGNAEPIKIADIVFISVPVSVAPKVIKQTSKIVKPSCLLVDLSSVKTETSKTLKSTGLPSLAMHLLFGPGVTSIQNQKIIFCRIKDNYLVEKLKSIFEENGAIIFSMSPSEHDKQMAYIQALMHFANLALANSLTGINSGKKRKVSTPLFMAQNSVIVKTLSQNPALLAQIQLNNPYAPKVLENFIKFQNLLLKKIKAGDSKYLTYKFNKLHNSVESSLDKTEEKQDEEKTNSISKILLENSSVSYLGPEGTFSHQACLNIFKLSNCSLLPKQTIYDIFEAVLKNSAVFGVVPAENSTEGTVRETLDFLLDFDLKVNCSYEMPIHQNLLSKQKDIAKIKKIISHPQALAQCKKWIKTNFPNVTVTSSASTLSEVEKLSQNENTAIIGSKTAAAIHNLNILAENIEDNPQNVTKFYVISKDPKVFHKKNSGILLFLSIYNRVGILRDILDIFASYNINLSKLESRPSREKKWDYNFFIEADIDIDDPKLPQVLDLLKQYCPQIKIMGET